MQLDAWKSILNKLPKNYIIVFFTGLITGIITHLNMITNKYPNWDDIGMSNGVGVSREYGRWFLPILHSMGSTWSVPAVNGILFIVFVSLAAVLIYMTLDLKSTLAAVLVPIMMVTFPATCSIMTFMFTADIYAVGLILMCASAFLMTRYKWGFIPATMLITFSLGIYQAFITFVISLAVLNLIARLLKGESLLQILKQGLKDVCSLGVGTGVYIWLSKIIYPDMVNQTYAGVGNMGQVSILQLPYLCVKAIYRLVQFYVLRPMSFVDEQAKVINIGVVILVAVLTVVCCMISGIYKKIARMLTLIFLLICFPLGMSFVYVMAPEFMPYLVQLYAYVFVYLFLIFLLENIELLKKDDKSEKKIRAFVLEMIVSILLLLSAFRSFVVINEGYNRMGIAFQRAYNFYNLIYSELCATGEYQLGDGVLIVGEYYDLEGRTNPIEQVDIEDYKFEDLTGVATEKGLITSGVRKNFIRTYIGIDFVDTNTSEQEDIRNSKEFEEMTWFPAEGSIRKINDIWVIKLCDDGVYINE